MALLLPSVAGCGASSHEGSDAGVCIEGGCPADCGADPTAAGCACGAGTDPVPCYQGPPGTAGIGQCTAGLRSCEGGRWTSCDDRIPSFEVCDGVDNDCDGATDEDVTNPCGFCGPDCPHVRFGHEPGDEPFDLSRGDCTVRDGDLAVPEAGRPLIWIPNTPEGTISLVEQNARVELARFRTGPAGPSESPSRTSVDPQAAVYVANRAFDGQSSVTRIRAGDCPDVDASGRVDSSRGPDDVLPWGEDECVDWHVAVGGIGAVADAVAHQMRAAFDGALERRVWVGLQNEERYIELDADTGEPTGMEGDCSGCRPVGARTDSEDRLWSACAGDEVCVFDTTSPGDSVQIIDLRSEGNPAAGLAVDYRGRVWVGGDVEVYDPVLGSFTGVPGVTATTLALGWDDNVWVGGCADAGSGLEGVTCRIEPDTLDVTVVDAPSRGIDASMDAVWAVPVDGTVSVIDLATLAVDVVLDDCDGPCLNEPDTWSGMAQPRMLTSGGGRCEWWGVVRGCELYRNRWALDWDAETPVGSEITIDVHSTDEPEGRVIGEPVRVVSIPPDVPPVHVDELTLGQYLVVRVTMRGDGMLPVLRSLLVYWTCADSNW